MLVICKCKTNNLIHTMIVIGIAGGTGSGKTTVVKRIVESFPKNEVVLLPQDSYYKDSSNVPMELAAAYKL